MNIEKNIEIFDTSYEGYGIGKSKSGQIIFTPYAVTGDLLNIEITTKKKNYLFGKINKINNASPLRKIPECPYYCKCGGCQFMHIKYENQLKIKENIIHNAFRKLSDFEINNIYYANDKRYRFRVKFKMFQNKIGFFAHKSNDFIAIEDCLLLKKNIVDKAKSFAKIIKNNLITDFYIIENNNNEALANLSKLNGIEQNTFDGIKFKNFQVGKNKLAINTASGKVYCGFQSFFQSNEFLLNSFQTSILNFLDHKDKVLELYAGSGFFSIALSSKVANVTAIEYEGESAKLFKYLNMPNVNFIKGNVDKIINSKKFDYNVLFIDPPRAGLSKPVINHIKKYLPDKIIYVSCNPITMARDITKLNEYKIINFNFFDMFPHTYHIESVATLIKK